MPVEDGMEWYGMYAVRRQIGSTTASAAYCCTRRQMSMEELTEAAMVESVKNHLGQTSGADQSSYATTFTTPPLSPPFHARLPLHPSSHLERKHTKPWSLLHSCTRGELFAMPSTIMISIFSLHGFSKQSRLTCTPTYSRDNDNSTKRRRAKLKPLANEARRYRHSDNNHLFMCRQPSSLQAETSDEARRNEHSLTKPIFKQLLSFAKPSHSTLTPLVPASYKTAQLTRASLRERIGGGITIAGSIATIESTPPAQSSIKLHNGMSMSDEAKLSWHGCTNGMT